MKENKQKAIQQQREFDEVQERLPAVEQKWITDSITKDNYDRCYRTYKHSLIDIQCAIERYSADQGKAYQSY